MMFWPWIRIREGLRWLFRGTEFSKLERDIERMAAPLAHQHGHDKAKAKVRRRVGYLVSCLPPERAEKFYDTMDRYGHSIRD